MKRRLHVPPLAIAFALVAAALVAATVSTRTTVGEAFETLRQGQAAAMNAAVRSDLGDLDGPPTSEAFEGIVKDHASDGLRYLAAFDPRGGVFAEAGTALGGAPARNERAMSITRIGDRLRVEARVMGRRSSGRRAYLLVMELDPVEARELEDAATTTLWIGAAAALVLLGVAIALVRRELRRAAEARKREHEQRLASLGEMSAVLAHEIKNPLASLKGNAQLLASMLPKEEKPRAKADRVVEEARRLEQLVQDLLAFVRTGELAKTEVEVGELVRAAAGEHAGVTVKVDAPAWPMDRERVRQVLTNLIDNAVAAGPPVEVTGRVEADRLVIEVADHGPGVPESDHAKIFEPFFTNKTRGTGLGLAIAKRIVAQHGGTISVRNDGGAVFRIEIPR